MEVVYVGRLGCGYQGSELIAMVTVRTGLSQAPSYSPPTDLQGVYPARWFGLASLFSAGQNKMKSPSVDP